MSPPKRSGHGDETSAAPPAPAQAQADPAFAGFPASARATTVPSVFFSELLPRIEDAAELRATLYAIYALGRHRGYPRFVSGRELASEAPLLAALGGDGDARPSLQRGLDAAVQRGSLLRVDVEQHDPSTGPGRGRVDSLYLLNTPSDRRAVELIRAGQIDLGRALPAESLAAAPEQRNVYRLYEENIGPLTPLVSQELKEAEESYPYEWFEDAFREAAQLNKRSWRYVARILERWAAEGRDGEKAGRASAAGDAIRARILGRFDR